MLILIAINSTKDIQIENPIVKYNNNEIITVKTEFLYNDILKRENNYYVEIDREVNNIIPVNVISNKKLDIIIKSNPKSCIVMKRANNGNYDKIYEAKDSVQEIFSINTPDEKGKHIYSISVSYKEGVGIYYFSIDVQNYNQEINNILS